MKWRILPDQLMYTKKTQNLVAAASNDHTQQPPQSNCHRLSRWNIFAALSPTCKQAFLVSMALWCSIRCNTSNISPPIVRNIGSVNFFVVNILILEVFKFKPTAATFNQVPYQNCKIILTSCIQHQVIGVVRLCLTSDHHHKRVRNAEHEASFFWSHVPSQH